ncbi:hypothetical protein Mal4_44800 [Maioricimonas rarisocia]|uniref:Uncharacterized protein n=1 Tax=Maioricimonas rarisocia TaxID=2528026 RepID=A0A517ZCE1_9PLAN|nr:hypothetical protein Mal4_44800 [Maioricimonas rarisocia]
MNRRISGWDARHAPAPSTTNVCRIGRRFPIASPQRHELGPQPSGQRGSAECRPALPDFDGRQHLHRQDATTSEKCVF